ncbi:SRPBCC family protein [Actinokineospora diospyrosa]|uniref:Polyketide cyclase / dehydrase and lipid transport n=1 Tax=Actinokineospora diospyrosa TaxID=103728 RepID=A0ABT1IEI1_9PSEU|nr:SRPBCC family protein [Actinokineospora diospyrosa]MCP2271047.1 Polyketide cyclase / dehydrase and lipid transport [Actinokineospora diospyrosa]
MVDVTRTFTVQTAPDAVLDYLRDFARAEEWDPGTIRCDRLDDGPVRVGSTWRNVSKFLGSETELTYELTAAEADRLRFVGKNDTATSTDDIRVLPGEHQGTSSVTYHAHVEFHGAAKLAAPLAKIALEKLGTETEDNLVRILGGATT